jgi:hypothetical protein
MARYTALRAFFVLAVVLLVIPPVLGADVAIGPASIGDRDPISIALTNVTDGSLLNTTLTAAFLPAPGVTWFNLTNWNYPFTLEGGRVVVAGRNVNQLILIVRAGSTIRMRRESGAGAIDLEIPLDLQPFTYHDYRIGYEVHDAGTPLTFTLIQQGTKKGTETDAVLTPSIIGVETGNLTVEVLLNGTVKNRTGIRIVKPGPPATPAPVNATASPTTPAPATTGPTTAGPTTASLTTAPATPATTTSAPTPPPATPTPFPRTTAPPAPEAPTTPSTGPSPFIIVYVAAIILITVIADYLLLKD